MKIRLILAVGAALVTMSCQQDKKLVLTNPLDQVRADEVVVIERASLEGSFTPAQASFVPVVKNGEQLLASQVDDLDGDGEWDELAVLVSLQPKEELTLAVDFVDPAEYPEFTKRTNLRLGIDQGDHTFKEVDYYLAPDNKDGFEIIAQGESVSWENDKMGFRCYFDVRNVKDLYGKLKPDMVLDKIHTPELGDYHTLADWGMDVLHCGSSLGSGGLALLENDSLYRLGSTETYEYQKIVEGPVRSVFDLKYGGWDVDGQNLSAVERVSIYPGKYWFQSDVTVSGFTGEKQVVTGIVTSLLKNEPFQFDADVYKAIATLDVQSLNNDELGMAVLAKADEVTRIDRTTDINFFELGYQTVPEKNFSQVISETYYLAQKITNDVPARHFFFAVWGLENPKWKEISEFEKYISGEAEKLSNPVVVTIR
ncbi:DUF4861 domain-containing protein [Gaoshiqia sediminis]|uniref:DUF4861 domain-containing protein n=1 Tax=Gaoshiqia sediminis TaxID=2986998 RepID=A0AA42C6V1_9BACT|nr:DUF4861 domain-containing protein [Gaoshiqia sediminis]MCW0484323.1 DUF4861 domain-containing protein [Gaoshiqia sediminis]